MRSASAFLVAMALFSVCDAAEPAKLTVGLSDVIDTVQKSFLPGASGQPAVTTVVADFFQTSTLKSEKKEFKAEGEMSVRFATSSDPLMFRFDYFRPMPQEIVSNGRTMWVYLPANRQVIISDVSFVFNPRTTDPRSERAVNFLQGLGRISNDFLITYSSEGGDVQGNYVLELTPRRASAMIAKLYLVVNRESVHRYVTQGRKLVFDPLKPEIAFPIMSSTMVDHHGNLTVMEFSNIRSNVWLSDGLFNFILPAGVQIVRPPLERQP